MKYLVIITADTNDADYVRETHEDVDIVTVELLKRVAVAIRGFKNYKSDCPSWKHSNNWPTGDCLREDLGEKSPEEIYVATGAMSAEDYELFRELIPYSEYGIHTIESIEVYEYTSKTNIL